MQIEENVTSKPNIPNLNPNKIHLGNRIGRGCQGSVYEGYNQQNMQKYAIKILNTSSMTEKELQRLKRQIQSNFTLSIQNKYKYFPYFYGYWRTQTHTYLVFQKCESNALQGIYSNRKHTSSYSFAYVLLYDILNALELLQQKNIVHRDLKPQNILLHQGIFKICDLGLSRIVKKGKKLTIDVGNIMSRSPQFYSGNYDCKTDIWSLGINVSWIAFGDLPFDQKLKEIIKQKNIIEIVKVISSKDFTIDLKTRAPSYILEIIKNMLEIQSNNRLSASEILNLHFRGIQFKQNQQTSHIKYLFFQYLMLRKNNSYQANLYLILMLFLIDFTKMDDYLKHTQVKYQQKSQNFQEKDEVNKKQIIRRIKLNIYYMINFIYVEQSQSLSNNTKYLFEFYQNRWYKELFRQEKNHKKLTKTIKNIDQGLQMHTIKSIRQKFPMIVEGVKIYKKLRDLQQKQQLKINVWDIELLNLRKLGV